MYIDVRLKKKRMQTKLTIDVIKLLSSSGITWSKLRDLGLMVYFTYCSILDNDNNNKYYDIILIISKGRFKILSVLFKCVLIIMFAL